LLAVGSARLTASELAGYTGPHTLPSFPESAWIPPFSMKIDYSAGFCRSMKKGETALTLRFLVQSL
jgi:hypothetical protein